jgi:hypothetical protein
MKSRPPALRSVQSAPPDAAVPQSAPIAAARTSQPLPAVYGGALLEAQIALAAYFRAEGRGFAPGGELEDWLAAEREVRQRQ